MASKHNNRIRVLKFVNQFYIGGTEQQFVHVANGLSRSRFDVEIGCFMREGPLLNSLDADLPVSTYPLHGSLYHWRSLMSQLRLMKDVREKHFDIVHTYGWYPNVFGIPPSRLARVAATIASIRDAGAYMTPAKIKALKFACRLADCVLANSDAGRRWLIEQGVDEQKIEVIHNGILVPPYAKRMTGLSAFRRQFAIPADVPICACIGRVVSGKGIDVYLRAARTIADRGSDVRFLMIGADSSEQSYRGQMEALVRELKIESRVIFTGQRQDVRDILRDVDIVVHPSLTEGLSNVILEAMAAAIPVVATRVGGNPELVEDGVNGFLVPVENSVEIASAVCRLLDEPGMARAFGRQGRQRVVKEFAIERMLSRTEALYFRIYERRLASTPPKQVHSECHERNSFIN